MQIAVIGLDLAKNVFQVHGIDDSGQAAVKRKLRRSEVLPCPASHNPRIRRWSCGRV
jgi:transposase